MNGTTADGDLNATLAGEPMRLTRDRALVWPRRRTAFIGDTHFGKAGVFRRAGLAIPAGRTEDDLARLGALVRRHAIERLVVLGDFFHAGPAADDPFLDRFREWHAAFQALSVVVIRGNHDRQAGHALSDSLEWLPPGSEDAPFELHHEPRQVTGSHVLAGHLHPMIRLAGHGADRARLPVFWLRPGLTVLPAFGGFTGGSLIRPDAADQLMAITPERVLPLPTTGR